MHIFPALISFKVYTKPVLAPCHLFSGGRLFLFLSSLLYRYSLLSSGYFLFVYIYAFTLPPGKPLFIHADPSPPFRIINLKLMHGVVDHQSLPPITGEGAVWDVLCYTRNTQWA